MGKWKEVCRCKECGKIYDNGIPYICVRCGTVIGEKTPILLQSLGQKEVMLTSKCEKVIAKKGFLGWKIK